MVGLARKMYNFVYKIIEYIGLKRSFPKEETLGKLYKQM